MLNAQLPEVTITDSDLLSGSYTWTSDSIYILDGLVFLEEGGVLNIQKGCIIKARLDPSTGDDASALIITRNAEIRAIGDYFSPIIFI